MEVCICRGGCLRLGLFCRVTRFGVRLGYIVVVGVGVLLWWLVLRCCWDCCLGGLCRVMLIVCVWGGIV